MAGPRAPKWGQDLWSDFFGSGGKGSDAGLMKLGANFFEFANSTLGPEGFIAYPKKTWDHWADQLQGGGGDDGGSSGSSSSTILTKIEEIKKIVPYDHGLTDVDTDPLEGDTQMSTYLAQKRRKIGNKKGRVDTMLTRGQDTADVNNRMMLY